GGAYAELETLDIAGHVFPDSMFEIEVDGLAGVAAQVLKPVVAGTPGGDEKRGSEQAPGGEPHEMREPVHQERHLVVVVRESSADEAHEVFVDEVEVPEAVDVSECGMIADRMALIRIAQAAEDMPWRGD